jgi:hypothetical protein
MKGIAGTGFIVAFANRSDRHHAWAVSLAEGITEPCSLAKRFWPKRRFN